MRTDRHSRAARLVGLMPCRTPNYCNLVPLVNRIETHNLIQGCKKVKGFP